MNLKDKNIVLVIIDSLSAFRTPIHGYERDTTPFLKELAEDNTVADFCYSASSWSLPSHASILSGKLPSEHGATSETMIFEEESLADELNNSGYKTLGLTPNYFINKTMGFGKEFDYFTDHQSEIFLEEERKAFKAFQHKNRWQMLNGIEFVFRCLYHRELDSFKLGWDYLNNGWDINDRGAEKLNSIADEKLTEIDDKNFFMLVTYMELHNPGSIPDDEIVEEWVGEEVNLKGFQSKGKSPAKTGKYDSAAKYVDSKLEELYRKIMREKPDTVFVITSDHGQNQGHYDIGEHSFWGHQYALTENTIRVPLIIAGEEIEDNNIEENISHIELRKLITGKRNVEDLGQEEVYAEYFGGYNFLNKPWEKDISNLFHQIKNLNIDRTVRAFRHGLESPKDIKKFYKNKSKAVVSGRCGYIANSHLPDWGFKAKKDSFSEVNLVEEMKNLKEKQDFLKFRNTVS